VFSESRKKLIVSKNQVCYNLIVPARITTEEFIDRARLVHGERYDYSLSVYSGTHKKISVKCKTHGLFEVAPANHLSGQNCPECFGMRRGGGTDAFIKRAKDAHGNRYDYGLTKYVSVGKKVEILCGIHGLFRIRPDHHSSGHGCSDCHGGKVSTWEDLQRKANLAHDHKYDYSKFVYLNAKSKSVVICPIHGEFETCLDYHIRCKVGCPRCSTATRSSVNESEIGDYVSSLGVEVKRTGRSLIPPMELDLYIPSSRLAVEYNGNFFHSYNPECRYCIKNGGIDQQKSHRKYKQRHADKFSACLSAGVTLYQIKENDWSDEVKREIWKSRISSRLGLHSEKIHARKTKFSQIDRGVAVEFLNMNHLQGGSASRYYFGLTYNGSLVGVISYSLHQGNLINLTRMAFRRWTTVVGGARKLFENSIKAMREGLDIVTFSDNMYSDGSIYKTLGFERDADLNPSYEWIYKQKTYNKRRCRKSNGSIEKLIGSKLYDPSKTEHQNMFDAGARCLYDAGYVRWIYKRTKPLDTTPETTLP
jgi:hypothetical protein